MYRITKALIVPLLAIVLAGCNFIGNTLTYKETTKEFVNTLIDENYDSCIDMMAMQHELAKGADITAMRAGLVKLRDHIVSNWGTDLEFSLVRSGKTFSTNAEKNMPPNTTLVMMEFSNQKELGLFQVLFDDRSKKILNIKTLDFIALVPNMTAFWLFGLLAVSVPIFNIYVIRRVKRSSLERKWLKYIAIFFFNTPAITYSAVSGMSFSLLNFQVLLGLSVSFMSYVGSFWTFGIPLGGIYWLWKIRRRNEELNDLELLVNIGASTGSVSDNVG